MSSILKYYIQFALLMLVTSLLCGLLSSFAFLYPEIFNKYIPFYQLRPFHVSAALFWIISAATAGVMHYKKEVLINSQMKKKHEKLFIVLWISTILIIFSCYALKIFGGREYWEFPPILSLPLLISWLVFMFSFYKPLFQSKEKKPLYVWMWATGIFFFLITFLEQNVWLIPWFRSSFIKEVTIQWKSNGSMVGAWNQIIYGTALYLMVLIGGDKKIAETKKAFFFYFLGFTNLMFNWGHHIYNVPNAGWIRNTAYIISMTELLFFVNIIMDFKSKLDEKRKFDHIIPYRFLIAAEFWVFANLTLALLISVPAINRYTHGTHITVAHAMGATIGINTMILLGSLGYILQVDQQSATKKRWINIGYWISQISLGIFWISLIFAGILKGYRSVKLNMDNFQEVMSPVMTVLKIFSLSGVFLAVGLGIIAINYIIMLNGKSKDNDINVP